MARAERFVNVFLCQLSSAAAGSRPPAARSGLEPGSIRQIRWQYVAAVQLGVTGAGRPANSWAVVEGLMSGSDSAYTIF
jgi:hypothetical protein